MPKTATLSTKKIESISVAKNLIVKNNNLLYTPISEIENNTDKYKILTIYSKDEMIIPTDKTEIGYEDSIAILVKSKYLDDSNFRAW